MRESIAFALSEETPAALTLFVASVIHSLGSDVLTAIVDEDESDLAKRDSTMRDALARGEALGAGPAHMIVCFDGQPSTAWRARKSWRLSLDEAFPIAVRLEGAGAWHRLPYALSPALLPAASPATSERPRITLPVVERDAARGSLASQVAAKLKANAVPHWLVVLGGGAGDVMRSILPAEHHERASAGELLALLDATTLVLDLAPEGAVVPTEVCVARSFGVPVITRPDGALARGGGTGFLVASEPTADACAEAIVAALRGESRRASWGTGIDVAAAELARIVSLG
jgi:hypothetical protein